MAKPLHGILVVALEQAVAAPFATCRLGDAGARIIKIERPDGDFARHYDRAAQGHSAYFVWLNRGKESIALDIKAAGDRALLERMLAKADVFVQNLGPGAAARAGFAPAALRRRFPRLITCSISGYGEDGPYRAMKAYDLLIQGETGLASITGSLEAPGRVGVSVSDIAAGLNAYAAILEALYARERSGEGAALQVALFDATAEWMAVPLLHFENGGQAPARVGVRHPSIAPYGAFPTGDGKAIILGIQNEREWQRLCAQVLGDAALASDPRFCDNVQRVANRPALEALIADRFARRTRDEVAALLTAADIAFGHLNEVADLARHPQLRRVAATIGGATISLPAPPGGAGGGEVPYLDQHGAALRREFGD
ncbi:MAG TPA: CaiB/BaiF CoA-transferase family protein [Stellaceae bacterium]|jgi:crotonobetainyl-CoA:carnitine CoA-transferase CaiB-like acyl-CoA transferase|nr:CaiB/BaiF CoA-transferase family protein [Stellaceae bacterium]